MSSSNTGLLVLLVGSNPLPNYLAACALKPNRIALVHTKETVNAMQRLQEQLQKALPTATFVDDPSPFVKDAASATIVRRVMDDLLKDKTSAGDIHLNYTGGTKVMAAHARMAFGVIGGEPKHASYLDEGSSGNEPHLRFDDGSSVALSKYPGLKLNLDTLLALHNMTHIPRTPKPPAPTYEDARNILCGVLGNTVLASQLYEEKQRLEKFNNPKNAIPTPFNASLFGLNLSQPTFPIDDQLKLQANAKERESWFEQWYKFIGGEWLEEWVGKQIELIGLQPAPEIVVGVNAFRGEQKANLEVDIAVIRGHRSYFISCTTDATRGMCKSKLFEIAVRSRHLGGELARAALVCLANDTIVGELQATINDVWGASNTTRIFGISDIRNWSDCGEDASNTQSLKDWLES